MSCELHIILGCFGRTDDGFVSCAGCRNSIFYLAKSDSNYSEIMDFLDGIELFDKPLLDYNAVRHVIFNLQDRFSYKTKKIWSEKMFLLYQKFVIDHKGCGLFIDLEIGKNESNN